MLIAQQIAFEHGRIRAATVFQGERENDMIVEFLVFRTKILYNKSRG
jgi:hypothetical protein